MQHRILNSLYLLYLKYFSMKTRLFYFLFIFSCSINILAQTITPVELRTHMPAESSALYPCLALPANDKGAYIIGNSEPTGIAMFYGIFKTGKRTIIKTD